MKPTDTNLAARRKAARNPATPPDLLAAFVKDPDVGVRLNLVRNPATPPDVIKALKGDPDPDVQWALSDLVWK